MVKLVVTVVDAVAVEVLVVVVSKVVVVEKERVVDTF